MPPYTFVDAGGNRTKFRGPFINIMLFLAKSLNVTYDVSTPREPQHGFYINGTWTGILGAFMRNESDVAFVPFAPNLERSQAADFSTTFWFSHFTVLSGKPRGFSKGADIYFSMLEPSVWVALGLSFVICSTISSWTIRAQHIFKNNKETDADYYIHLLVHYGSLLGQGFPIVHSTFGGRAQSISWLFLVLLINTCYFSSLRIMLTFGGYPERVDSLADILKYPKIRPVVAKGTICQKFIEKSLQPAHQILWNRIKSTGGNIFHKEILQDPRLEATYNGQEVIISDMYSLEFGVGLSCHGGREYYFAREHFLSIPMVIALRKNLKGNFLERISHDVLLFADAGHVQKGFQIVMEGAERCKLSKHLKSERALNVEDLKPMFIVWALGLCCSLVAVIGEVVYFLSGRGKVHILKKESSNKVSQKRRNRFLQRNLLVYEWNVPFQERNITEVPNSTSQY